MKELKYEIIAEIIEPASGSNQDHIDAVISHFEDSIRESKIHNTDTQLVVKSLKLISGDKHSVRIEKRDSANKLFLENKETNYYQKIKQRLRNKTE